MEKITKTIPIIPQRGRVALPGEVLTIDVGRSVSRRAVNEAVSGQCGLILLCQRAGTDKSINTGNMYGTGTYCTLSQTEETGDSGMIRITLRAQSRFVVDRVTRNDGDFYEAEGTIVQDEDLADDHSDSLKSNLSNIVAGYVIEGLADQETLDRLRRISSSDYKSYADKVACFFADKYTLKQQVLDCIDIFERYEFVCKLVIGEKKLAALDSAIDNMTRARIEKNQKEYHLREKMAAIRHELGDDKDAELEKMREQAKTREFPDYVRDRLEKEFKRLDSLPSGSHETPTVRGLIECILDLPWTEKTEDRIDIAHAREILDRDHYGLEKVKKRIIEYLSVAARTNNLSGQIICLVGAPGVGKTSIVSSIAEAVGRNFVRMSLGGIDDEAEIRGHRRTYIGAMPGRIITAMRQAKSINPVILFDEIDKLNKNVQGDPAAAMLEVLDSAQNTTFRDHFLELPYDLSQVMFITTANSLDTIPRPLLDRMEVIEVPGYLQFEKVQIAQRHLIPKQLKKHGIEPSELTFSDDAVAEIIDGYTHESGVRNLERIIASVCRNAACELAEGEKTLDATHERIVKYLGAPRFENEKADERPQVGIVNGLAWTQVGGSMLTVEVMPIPGGTGKLEITGNLGQVMQESAQAAYTYVRGHAAEYGVDSRFFKDHDIHIHVPEGAVPKDGPSAGVTLTTALMSAVAGIPVMPLLAMTGEVTIRGNVLKIGGLREKLLAAARAGIRTVIVPESNEADVGEMEAEIKDSLRIIYVETADEVLKIALQSDTQPVVPEKAQAQATYSA